VREGFVRFKEELNACVRDRMPLLVATMPRMTASQIKLGPWGKVERWVEVEKALVEGSKKS
jgi:hypothetical protein